MCNVSKNIVIMTERVVMYSKSLLGKRIKEIRKSKGFTQELLAESAGIDSKHLSRIECGVNFPSLDLLNKIAVLLNIEPSLLFQTGHLKDKTDIIKEINEILDNCNEKDLRLFYKILTDVTSS